MCQGHLTFHLEPQKFLGVRRVTKIILGVMFKEKCAMSMGYGTQKEKLSDSYETQS